MESSSYNVKTRWNSIFFRRMVIRNSGIQPNWNYLEKCDWIFPPFFVVSSCEKSRTPKKKKKDGPIGELGDVASGQGQSIPKPLWCPLRMTCVSHATLDRWQHELMRYGAVRVATGAILGRLAFIVIDFSCRETASFWQSPPPAAARPY